MKANFFKTLLLATALLTTSFAKKEQSKYANTATFIGGPVDGIDDNNKKEKCNDIDVKKLDQYAIVSKKVFELDDICEENYVVAISTDYEDKSKFKMIKARIVESSSACDDTQVIFNKEAYDKFSTNEEKTNIVWAVVNDEGKIRSKVNYEGFSDFDEFVGIPAEELEKIFEEGVKNMINSDVDAQQYPWDITESKNYSAVAAISVAVAGLACFAGYRLKSKKYDSESSLAIPDLPPLDSTINTVSDHPEGLPRVDIYNPPLEFYHFPMDTSYDIVDIRPDFYD